jgi:hypothetical protein
MASEPLIRTRSSVLPSELVDERQTEVNVRRELAKGDSESGRPLVGPYGTDKSAGFYLDRG